MSLPGQLPPPINNSLLQNIPAAANINVPVNLPPPPVTPTQVTRQNGSLLATPNTPPVVKTKVPKSEFKKLTNEWNATHEKLTANFRELNTIFSDIRFLLDELKSKLEAAGIKSDLSHCIDEVESCVKSFSNANAHAAALGRHLDQLDKNKFDNAPQGVQEILKKIRENITKARDLGENIGIPGAAQNASGTQSNQSAQSLPPSQSNQSPIHQIQQIIQTSSTDFQRHLSEIDSLQSTLQVPYNDGADVDSIRNNIVIFTNSTSSYLDQLDQNIQNSLNNFHQAPQNNQQQAQQAWAQVRTTETANLLQCEVNINLVSDDIIRIDSLISSITHDLLKFSPSLTAVSKSFNVFKENFAQKLTDFSNLNQQMQLPALSQSDSQQLLQSQQNMQLLVNSENEASQKMQNLFSNYQNMQANLTAHIKNRDDLRQAHQALVAKVKKIKDNLINNP